MGAADPLGRMQESAWSPGMRERRLHQRLLTQSLGVTVALEGPSTEAPLYGQLLDLSAGGCALATPTDPGLGPGSCCTVGLPVTSQGQVTVTPYPALVVGVEPHGRTAVVLRLRFRPRTVETQRQLLSCLRSLRVRLWQARAWDGAPVAPAPAATLPEGPAGLAVDSGTPAVAVPAHEGAGSVLSPVPGVHQAELAAVVGLLSAEEQRVLVAQVAETLERAGHDDDAALLRVVLSTQVVAPVIIPGRGTPTRPETADTSSEGPTGRPTAMAEPAESEPARHSESMTHIGRTAEACPIEGHDCPWCRVVQRCQLTGHTLPTNPPAPEYRCMSCGGTFAQQGALAVPGSPPILPP